METGRHSSHRGPSHGRASKTRPPQRRTKPSTKSLTAAALDIHLTSGSDGEWFKWFLASFLFGKRIQRQVAVRAYQVLVQEHRRDTPRKILKSSWQQLVDILDEGSYARYDESTAARLLELSRKLIHDYDGKISRIRDASRNRADLKQRLMEFKGVGPKTAEIFMREASPSWFRSHAMTRRARSS